MQAIVVRESGGPEALDLEERPVPDARPEWVLVRVRAFGLNRSELVTRAGGSGDAVELPRVLGIECVGEVVEAPGGDLEPGQTFLAAMGGMGRDYDGGYQQYALLPASQVIPVETTLDWARLGAIPEAFGTAWGSLERLALQPGETLLVQGGTSSVGRAAVTIAKDKGVTVIATTRQERKRSALEAGGADHVIVDDGDLVAEVRELAPGGVDALFELVGPGALVNALQALASDGRACIAGFLEGDWDVGPAAAEAERLGLPLARYGSSEINADSYGDVFREIVRNVEEGRYGDILDRTFAMGEIAEAHRYMEANLTSGKVVVLT